MSRIILAVVAIVASTVYAQVNDLNMIMTAEPSVDPTAAAQGLYLPGETVHFTVSLAMTDAPAPDVAIVQIIYGEGLIDYESDAIVPGFPLTDILNEGGFFGAATIEVPSPLTIPQIPDAIDFFTFNALAPAGLGQTELVCILGFPSVKTTSYAATSDFSIIWGNYDPDHDHDIVGGVLSLTSVPEPAALFGVAPLTAVCRRRKRLASRSRAAYLPLLFAVYAALSHPLAARAPAILDDFGTQIVTLPANNTVSEATETITFTTQFTNPTPGWSVVLTPPSVALDGDDPPATIQVTITPPLPLQSGASQTAHITAWIGTHSIGGVSIAAVVP